MDARSLLAGVLGVVLGAVLVAAPEVVVRAHLAGRVPGGRRGEYGDDGEAGPRWLLLVRLLGVGLVVGGLYFGATGLGLL